MKVTNIIKFINSKEFVICYRENGKVIRDHKTGLFNIKRELEMVKKGMKKEFGCFEIIK